MSILQRFTAALLALGSFSCCTEAPAEGGAEAGIGTASASEASADATQPPEEPKYFDMFVDGPRDRFYQTGDAGFSFQDGVLTGTARNLPRNSFLATKKSYADFEMEVEVKIAAGGNSGIQIRSELDEAGDRIIGYQIEIDTSKRAWSGGLFEEGKRGWLDDLKDNEAGRTAFKVGEWNLYRIRCQGDHIQSWVNGVQCTDYHDDASAEGRIAFQVHGGKEADVQWRNARIREL